MKEKIGELKAFLKKDLVPDLNIDELSKDQSLFESGVLDSLGILKLVAFIENNYQIKVNDEELIPENFERLASIAELISIKI